MSSVPVITSSLLFACAERAELPVIRRDGLVVETTLHKHLHEARQQCVECILVLDAWAENSPGARRPGRIENADPYLEPVPVTAAGGFVVRNGAAGVEVLLIFRRRKWDLPKGKLDAGESIEECALREVREELGISEITIKIPLGRTVHGYRHKARYAVKTTHWFAMSTKAIDFRPEEKERIERVEWVPLSEARDRLGFETLRRHLNAVEEELTSVAADGR